MNLKVYEKTRYQNIYRHKKNKNYIIMMSKPVKTSISSIDGKKIYSIDEACKIRDNPKLKQQKGLETIHKEAFDVLWDNYISNCKYIKKLAYNSINRKNKLYDRYLKNKITRALSKTNKDYWAKFIDDSNCSLKQKNHMIKELKAFFNWCVHEEFLLSNPLANIKNYKVPKVEMKYWIPSEIKDFFETLEKDLTSEDLNIRKKAYQIKTLTLIGFAIGDRVGETRALSFGNLDVKTGTLNIKHSINYDKTSEEFVSSTKTYESERIVDISEKLISGILDYKSFLINECKYKINDLTLIFLNHSTKKPYSDTALRNNFNYYCDKANVTRIRMYDLRHTFVTTMMSEGLELYYISSIIGHKSYSTTVNKYGHLSTETKKRIAKTTDKYY